jgi:DNA sulfur modification protein DndB
MAQTKALDKSLLLSFGEFEGRVGITKKLLERVPMFQGKTEKIKSSPSSKHKLIYTTNYIARLVSCAFTDNPIDELAGYEVEEASDALVVSLNQFFSKCSQTRHIFETPVDNLTVESVIAFKEKCILGRSVGLEILGRLLYYIYDNSNHYFSTEKVLQIAQLNWSRENNLWHGNVVLYQPNPENLEQSYKISANATSVRGAIDRIKATLGWM